MADVSIYLGRWITHCGVREVEEQSFIVNRSTTAARMLRTVLSAVNCINVLHGE
jgi:hypothetical protein